MTAILLHLDLQMIQSASNSTLRGQPRPVSPVDTIGERHEAMIAPRNNAEAVGDWITCNLIYIAQECIYWLVSK